MDLSELSIEYISSFSTVIFLILIILATYFGASNNHCVINSSDRKETFPEDRTITMGVFAGLCFIFWTVSTYLFFWGDFSKDLVKNSFIGCSYIGLLCLIVFITLVDNTPHSKEEYTIMYSIIFSIGGLLLVTGAFLTGLTENHKMKGVVSMMMGGLMVASGIILIVRETIWTSGEEIESKPIEMSEEMTIAVGVGVPILLLIIVGSIIYSFRRSSQISDHLFDSGPIARKPSFDRDDFIRKWKETSDQLHRD